MVCQIFGSHLQLVPQRGMTGYSENKEMGKKIEQKNKGTPP